MLNSLSTALILGLEPLRTVGEGHGQIPYKLVGNYKTDRLNVSGADGHVLAVFAV